MKILFIALIILFRTSFPQSGWVSQSSGTTASLNGLAFIDSSRGTAVGDSFVILNSTNGGATWTRESAGITDWSTNSPGAFYGISYFNNLGIIVGEAYNINYNVWGGYGGTLSTTENSGLNWMSTLSGTRSLYDLCFIDSNIQFFVGGGGTIGRTTDDGKSWSAYDPYITAKTLRGISFADNKTGTIVGDSGIIIRTTSGGDYWMFQSSGTSHTLRGISMSDYYTAFAVGDSGIILHTTNAGISWNSQSSGTSNTLRAVSMINSNVGFAVGDNGTILRTTDGGANWESQPSGTSNSLRAIFMITANNGFIVGDNGTILHTTNGGVTSVEYSNKVPTQFALLQNHPNPFNPSTVINYEISKSSFVKIKVYDVLGREIAIMVNEEEPAGKYSITFNGSNLSSGIYFYSITAGRFHQTKKMVLLR
jgi:photosystem II stability/assembly factor-like uncharacterized protein